MKPTFRKRRQKKKKKSQGLVMGHTAWMNGHSGHRVHVRLGDVFDRDRDVEIPSTNRLVIRSRNEPPILVHKSDSVDRPQVLVVLLRDLARPYVVLESETVINIDRVTFINRFLTCTIFLSDIPAKNIFCLSSSGWNRTTYGIFPLLKRLRHCPVSVSHSFICRSYPQDKNCRPSFVNVRSLTAFTCP